MLKMRGDVILLGIVALFALSIVNAANCDQNQIDKEIKRGEADEKAGLFDAAALDYSSAEACSEANKDFDNAINYSTKANKLFEKAGIMGSVAYGHMMIAGYYHKKGADFRDKIKEQCDLGEAIFLGEINKELAKPNPSFSTVYSGYDSLASCYKLVGDTQKACDYCEKDNYYRNKDGSIDPTDCSLIYGCPKSSSENSLLPSGGSVGSASGGLPLLPLAIGLVLIVVIVAFFLSRKKKK